MSVLQHPAHGFQSSATLALRGLAEGLSTRKANLFFCCCCRSLQVFQAPHGTGLILPSPNLQQAP